MEIYQQQVDFLGIFGHRLLNLANTNTEIDTWGFSQFTESVSV